jgi:hypothetical protein
MLANAQAAGAVGAILMNEGDSPGRMNAGFRAGPPDLAIPAVFSSFAVGQELLSLSHGALWRGRGGPDRTKGRG